MNETHSERHVDPLDAIEAEERGVADRLYDERPRPSAAFRGKLRRRLLGAGREGVAAESRPPIPLITGYLTGGVILLLAAAAGVAGIGPFAN
jgi:hypothetical protein